MSYLPFSRPVLTPSAAELLHACRRVILSIVTVPLRDVDIRRGAEKSDALTPLTVARGSLAVGNARSGGFYETGHWGECGMRESGRSEV